MSRRRQPRRLPRAWPTGTTVAASGCIAGTALDPFLGSGTTAVAALRTARRCVGIEADPNYIRLSVARVKTEARRAQDPLVR